AGLTDRPEQFGDGIHGWRCEYPDRYGRCDCLADLIGDLVRLVRDRASAAYDEGEASEELANEDARDVIVYAGHDSYRKRTGPIRHGRRGAPWASPQRSRGLARP